MASLFRSVRRLCIGLGFLTSLGAQSLTLFTEDPEWTRLVLDSVAAGTAKFQMKTGSDMPFSQRINSSLSSLITIRTYSRAGLNKSNETGNVSLDIHGISLTAGPVLVSHACGFVTGRATSRQNLRPGNTRLKSSCNIRLTPVLSSPFTGYGAVRYKKYLFSAFTTDINPGFSASWTGTRFSFSAHFSPDQLVESLFQLRMQKILIRINTSLASDLSQPGHAYFEIVINNKSSGLKIISYATSKNFKPVYGKNPWFGGETASCLGGGGGLMIRPVKSLTINASVIQQICQNDDKVTMEILAIGNFIPSFKSETLIRYNYEQFLITEKTPPVINSYQVKELLSIKQAFHVTISEALILQTSWSAAYNRDLPSTAGLILLQYKSQNMLFKMQFSQIYGGTADLWYVRPFAGTQISIRKASNGIVSVLDFAGETNIQNISFTSGLSLINGSINAVVQIKFALDSMNR